MLERVAESSDNVMLGALLDAGVSPSLPNVNTSETAVFGALMSGRAENVALLIDRGVDLSATDRSGNTALHQAALISDADSAFLLLQAGAPAAAENNQGVTFQRYLFATPEEVLSDRRRAVLDRIREELRAQGVVVEG